MPARAVVIGTGPNGLAAAITLAQAGLDVEIREAEVQPGGGARSGELTLPGFVHDLGSAVYPFAAASPFFNELRLDLHGLRWVEPSAPLAHPLDDGTAVMLEHDIRETAENLDGQDARAYGELLEPIVDHWDTLFPEVLQPLMRVPRHPLVLARFGLRAVLPASLLARALFKGVRARALFGGLAAHSILKLEQPLTSAFAILFAGCGHTTGWPMAAGGAQNIMDALISVFTRLGGRLVTGSRVNSLAELDDADLTLCDISPKGFLRIAQTQLEGRPFADLMRQYKYGPAAFKMDWALREPIPWRAKECLRAGTVHVCGTLDEIASSERAAAEGKAPTKPFILLAQPSLFDSTRAPAGQHTAWAYCHVPNGWTGSAQQAIEDQIERFAPGFRDCVLARSCLTPRDLESTDENLVGGDVNCGTPNVNQFLFRPTWREYGTPLNGVYLCSSATPPGGGVHGMCGHNAATVALKWLKRRGR